MLMIFVEHDGSGRPTCLGGCQPAEVIALANSPERRALCAVNEPDENAQGVPALVLDAAQSAAVRRSSERAVPRTKDPPKKDNTDKQTLKTLRRTKKKTGGT